MAISNKDRKILWSRSGNRCAMCRQELVIDATQRDDRSLIGEECHIVARELNGPRGSEDLAPERRDSYDNLIVLCRVHHKLIDDQPHTFSVHILKELKSLHELWVRQTLKHNNTATNDNFFITYRIDTGKQLTSMIESILAYRFDNDELLDMTTAEQVGTFFQDVRDFADIWSVFEPRDRVVAQIQLNEQISSLASLGFLLYGGMTNERFGSSTNSVEMQVLNLLALHSQNSKLVRKDEQLESIMQIDGQKDSKFTNFIVVMRR